MHHQVLKRFSISHCALSFLSVCASLSLSFPAHALEQSRARADERAAFQSSHDLMLKFGVPAVLGVITAVMASLQKSKSEDVQKQLQLVQCSTDSCHSQLNSASKRAKKAVDISDLAITYAAIATAMNALAGTGTALIVYGCSQNFYLSASTLGLYVGAFATDVVQFGYALGSNAWIWSELDSSHDQLEPVSTAIEAAIHQAALQGIGVMIPSTLVIVSLFGPSIRAMCCPISPAASGNTQPPV